jgi:RNA polymerase sigma-70 factor, ECF subfamily
MTSLPPVVVGELLAKVALGDRPAFRAFYAEAGPRLFAICLRMMRNRDEAEDVLQETFVRIWERSHLYDPAKGAGLAWAATIARHCSLDRLRKPGRDHQPFDEQMIEQVDSHVAGLDHSGEGHDLKRCLGALREDYRNAVILAYMNGLTHEELSEQLGKPLGTIKSWVRRGLDQLKDCMSV